MARFAFIVAAFALTTACDTWLGESEAPPLPGERISVLAHERELTPEIDPASDRILLPAPLANPDWPQPGGYANHAMHHIAVGDVLRKAWVADAGDGADDDNRVISSPVIAAGRIVAMDAESAISAFDAKSGQRLWQTELTPEDEEDEGHFGGGITLAGGLAYVTTGFAQVIALDVSNGAVVWRRSMESPMRAAPTERGGRLFVVTVDNVIHALDASEGGTLWTHTGIEETASLLGGGSPAVDDGVVVVPFTSGELVALRVANGRVLWTDTLTSRRQARLVTALAHIRGRPIIDRGRVFAMGVGDMMVSIDLRSGRRIWEREIGGLESPWIVGNFLYAITSNAEVIALSRDDGRIHWVTPLRRFEDEEDKQDPITWSGPILASDRVIVAGSHGMALAVSPYTGRILGRMRLPTGVSVPPVAADRSVFFLTDDAELISYR
ncbi:MAG: PQQ-binding-like beta-propeller repeat protein [Rhodospirillales bacterium]|nr:PQQ-binding-like beta-propeller repeat protein [Rhodospirillales bacterium]